MMLKDAFESFAESSVVSGYENTDALVKEAFYAGAGFMLAQVSASFNGSETFEAFILKMSAMAEEANEYYLGK